MLTVRQKWRNEKENIKDRQLVLIQTESPRGQWPQGLVMERIKGRDGRGKCLRVNNCHYFIILRLAYLLFKLNCLGTYSISLKESIQIY